MKSRIPNKAKASIHKKNYARWKADSLKTKGFFVMFNGFLDRGLLREISGGALKLYIFLGIKSDNTTGESFYTLLQISNYFATTERTVGSWFKTLEKLGLIYRYQLKPNSVSHTYLGTYDAGKDRNNLENG